MTTATKQPRTARRREPAGAAPAEFRVFENNNGGYQWVIVSRDGVTLAQSGAFASVDDAEHAAKSVHDGAAGARLAARGADATALTAA